MSGNNLMQYLPSFWHDVRELKEIFQSESNMLFYLNSDMAENCNNTMLELMDEDSLKSIESWLGVEARGNINQRRDYLLAIKLPGRKLNKSKIEQMVKQITGCKCKVTFQPAIMHIGSRAVLKITIILIDNTKSYRHADISRAISPLIPTHIDLEVSFCFYNGFTIGATYSHYVSDMAVCGLCICGTVPYIASAGSSYTTDLSTKAQSGYFLKSADACGTYPHIQTIGKSYLISATVTTEYTNCAAKSDICGIAICGNK